MRLEIPILLICFNCPALDLFWTASPYNPQGYAITHWGSDIGYVEQIGAGSGTNYTYSGTLSPGPNYFAVSSYILGGTNFLISVFSNIAVVTNAPALILKSVTFGSTNLAGSWTPFQTNQILIYPTDPILFLKTANSLTPTNQLTFPSP